MVPLSKKYFIDYVNSFDENKFYVMTSDNPECLRNREYQMCYNIAKPQLFKDVFQYLTCFTTFSTFFKNNHFKYVSNT